MGGGGRWLAVLYDDLKVPFVNLLSLCLQLEDPTGLIVWTSKFRCRQHHASQHTLLSLIVEFHLLYAMGTLHTPKETIDYKDGLGAVLPQTFVPY